MHYLGLAEAKFATNLFKHLYHNFPKSQTIELYSVLDIILELNIEDLVNFFTDFKVHYGLVSTSKDTTHDSPSDDLLAF